MYLKIFIMMMTALCSQYSLAYTDTYTPTDESACDEDGLCIIFSVSVKLDAPVQRTMNSQRTERLTIHNETRYYRSDISSSGNRCQKHVRVPKPVFMSIVNLLASLNSLEQRPAFTPSQQTMLLFYTTIMQQTLQFTCSGKDLQNSNSAQGDPAQ
jgi:hypothetical protein